jgi:hypothetical protein
MAIVDAFKQAGSAFRAALQNKAQDTYPTRGIRGDVKMVMRNCFTGSVEHQWERKNLVVSDASILVARVMRDPAEPPHGIFALAIGTGDTGWNVLNPPAATVTQRSLYGELTRKVFSAKDFIGAGGTPVGYPTNVVDFTTTFTESEAVGPLCEMGLIGGNISTNMAVRNPVLPPNGTYDPTVNLTQYETLVNYLTFNVISKPATSILSVTWRITF